MLMVSASVQQAGPQPEVERFSITIERTEISGLRWQVSLPVEEHFRPDELAAFLAGIRQSLTEALDRGEITAFSISERED